MVNVHASIASLENSGRLDVEKMLECLGKSDFLVDTVGRILEWFNNHGAKVLLKDNPALYIEFAEKYKAEIMLVLSVTGLANNKVVPAIMNLLGVELDLPLPVGKDKLQTAVVAYVPIVLYILCYHYYKTTPTKGHHLKDERLLQVMYTQYAKCHYSKATSVIVVFENFQTRLFKTISEVKDFVRDGYCGANEIEAIVMSPNLAEEDEDILESLDMTDKFNWK